MGAFRFTESAETDVDTVISYTMATWGDAQADAYIGGLFHILELISENPSLGRARSELAEGLHSFPYREHLIFYLIHDDAILVVRVLAAKQGLKSSFFKR
ncbi:type II toxin-antitoxin system RelE/ParE family toxin [Shinella curvata]|uniref:Toxin n=1 Tax=Shinella curvata TaxID=1817964 RepID=A0ABT8XGP1_9HYPH|nr:type II toxin-antitoxin system RelE/ParE family toxin [Shinella curvata]MCJ8053208.1 type II toxin-antitoxin system RelE/ParE family toxin [Shinella curvata]MDO6122539.1 type II toxin-antitoxin system RelE/ParE family toxin [Shinella curvata]